MKHRHTTHTDTHTHTCTHTYIHTKCAHTFNHSGICTHTQTCMRTYTCMVACTRLYTYTLINVHMLYLRTHEHINAQLTNSHACTHRDTHKHMLTFKRVRRLVYTNLHVLTNTNTCAQNNK